MTFKLYKFDGPSKKYWETWDNGDGTHTVHWGNLGEKGQSKNVRNSLLKKATKSIQAEVHKQIADGFHPCDELHTLLVEYEVEGFGTPDDLDKRHRLEDRMNETLGWTGLGHCDGGSIGSGTMEVCTFVVDANIAKTVISGDLKGTEFENFSRIYVEE